MTQPRAAPAASPGTALHVLDCNSLALHQYFPSLRHSWNSRLWFCQVYLRHSHKHVAAMFLKPLSQNFHQCQTLRLQLKSVKALFFSSCCISSCDIYDLSLLAVFSVPCSASSLQNPNKPKQNTATPHPDLSPTLHGIRIGIPWDQRSGAGGIFLPLCAQEFRENGRTDSQPSVFTQPDFFFNISWDGRMPLLPTFSKAASLERRGMENSAPDLKSFQAEVLPEESQL